MIEMDGERERERVEEIHADQHDLMMTMNYSLNQVFVKISMQSIHTIYYVIVYFLVVNKYEKNKILQMDNMPTLNFSFFFFKTIFRAMLLLCDAASSKKLFSNEKLRKFLALYWFGLVCWVLWHINLCRLFNAKSIFM